MKKSILMLLIVVGATFSSCSNSGKNDTEVITTNPIVGAWIFDADPGYGNPTFYPNNRVEFKYIQDGYSDWGNWIMIGNNLKIQWDSPDVGSEIYDTTILELSNTKLRWNVSVDGQVVEESFTRVQ